ncbi:MAG TPA: hypothetical protein VM123_10835 [archaeon]|nr:hypothetical protein [archaeon]
MVNKLYQMRLPDETEIFLARYRRYKRGLGFQVREDSLTLAGLIKAGERELLDKFTDGELNLIRGALNRTVYPAEMVDRLDFLLVGEISDAIKLGHLDQEYQVNGQDLIAKVERLSLMETLALWHQVRLFWARR